MNLGGTWRLQDVQGEYKCDMAVPGDGISALYAAQLIPDPYWGRNELDLRWICERNWVLRRKVDLDDTDVILEIAGLDTIATVRWNGQVVIEGQNVHRTYRWALDNVARLGENEIEITFRSPVHEAAKRQAAQPFRIPYSVDNNPIPNGNMLRKTQCDFGWDWNIALAPFGVLGDIRLVPARAIRIEGVHIRQDHQADGSVNLWVGVDAAATQEGKITVEFAGETQELHLTAEDAQKRFLQLFTIKEPRLWWPAGQGDQPLYDLSVTCGDQVERRRIGLRKIDLITEPDKAGASFTFRVNGRDIFAKGANWIPADALASRIAPDATRDLLQSAVDANMNMLRVWGGGRYEPDWFYDICDEMGLMVWQDFMFACSLYPSTPDFLAEVDAEVREVVARLQHRACIALWCGDNELVGALTWFEESRADRDRYLVNYDRLNRTIETALRETDPGAIWWPSSPSLGHLDFGDGWHDAPSGDMHFWSVWHENREFAHYRDVQPRFCSEFGFQSYPSNDVIATFANAEDRNIASPVFESHQKNAGGNERIAATMFREFRFPVDFENFVYVSQVQQAVAIKTAAEYWRSLKPHCMGTLYWQLNDTWPVCSWSSLDYGGGWKLLHHFAKNFYENHHVVAIPEADSIRLIGLNDGSDMADYSVDFAALKPDGTRRELGAHEKQIAPLAPSELARVLTQDLADDEMLVYRWMAHDQQGWDIFAPKPFKAYDLHAPGLELTVEYTNDEYRLTLTARNGVAYFVAVEANQPGRFSHAGFHVLPGEPMNLRFTPTTPGETPNFTIRDLYSATYGTA